MNLYGIRWRRRLRGVRGIFQVRQELVKIMQDREGLAQSRGSQRMHRQGEDRVLIQAPVPSLARRATKRRRINGYTAL